MNSRELKRVEQLKHFESILGNCISYLWEIWNNESYEDIRKSFEKLGFTKEDMEYWEINEELLYMEEYNNAFGGSENE